MVSNLEANARRVVLDSIDVGRYTAAEWRIIRRALRQATDAADRRQGCPPRSTRPTTEV